MHRLLSHLRNKLLAGLFAIVPIAIGVYVVLWIETHTRVLTTPLGIDFPGLGIVIGIVGLYLLGVIVTSFVGRLALGLVSHILQHVPGVNLVYKAWRDVLVIGPNQHGMFHQVVLVPLGGAAQLGFTSGLPLPGDSASICVLLPNIPSPLSGRLVVVPRAVCVFLKMSVEEALKYQLSSGNYLPPELSARPLTSPQR